MAQVYQFVDDNGVTRLFAEIVPDPAGTPFNGGTITAPLKIDPTAAGGAYVLDLEAPSADGSVVLKVINSASVEKLTVADDGGLTTAGGLAASGTVTLGGVANTVQLYLLAGPVQASAIAQVYSSSDLAFQFGKGGHAIISVHSAPADGDLAAGECALWFDQTNGAAKLMVKAKQADGAVKTAAVALS